LIILNALEEITVGFIHNKTVAVQSFDAKRKSVGFHLGTIAAQLSPMESELLGRRTLANEKMVNRVGRHKCGVTLWQM
jgi:hypothetical protein